MTRQGSSVCVIRPASNAGHATSVARASSLVAFALCTSCATYEYHCELAATWNGGTTKAPTSRVVSAVEPTGKIIVEKGRREACFALCSERLLEGGRSNYERSFGTEAKTCQNDCVQNAGAITVRCTRGRKVPSGWGAFN